MLHLHINEKYWAMRDRSPRRKHTAEVMGKWFELYRRDVKIYLLFEPGELF